MIRLAEQLLPLAVMVAEFAIGTAICAVAIHILVSRWIRRWLPTDQEVS